MVGRAPRRWARHGRRLRLGLLVLLVLLLLLMLLVLTRLLQGVGRTPGNVVVLLFPELGLLLHASAASRPVVS